MMRHEAISTDFGGRIMERLAAYGANFPRRSVIGLILLVALLAFEIFNFDTTRYALDNLLGPVSFAGLGWASILAIAFCAIDFAGLVRLFTPENGGEQPKEVWYLMGAWLLGATMNALMTWWAVSLTLINHDFGNEVLSRGQLLQIVPVFVAVLVWLTRILFIGALTVAGGHLLEFGFNGDKERMAQAVQKRPLRQRHPQPLATHAAPAPQGATTRQARPVRGQHIPRVSDELPAFLGNQKAEDAGEQRQVRPSVRRVVDEEQPAPAKRKRAHKPNGRVRQRPPVPGLSAGPRKRA